MPDVVISVEKLSKLYRIGLKDETPDTLAGSIFSWLKAPFKNFKRLKGLTHFDSDENADDILRALQDVSFEVKRGEVVGIIGRNGAGKSTLLKILSRITAPTSGRVVLNGRVGSLLEVGTGFHPELTGRDNIYMNGTILGMTKAEIDQKLKEIIAFSGIERFLDTPIKRYSSGMKVRLAFSVAAHLEPEILIIDEVLAVGDAEFQSKCLGKMQNLAGEGRTVLFVSHQLEAVSNLCNKAILLNNGKIVGNGDTSSIIDQYVKDFSASPTMPLSERNDREGSGRINFVETWIETQDGKKVNRIKIGDPLIIKVRYFLYDDSIRKLIVSASLSSIKNIKLCDFKNIYVRDPFGPDLPKKGILTCYVPCVNLNCGSYYYNLFCESEFGVEDWIVQALKFEIDTCDYYKSGRLPDGDRLVLMDYDWRIDCERF